MENAIRSVRKAAGMTQQDLAKAVGVGVPQVSKWESGAVNIPSERLTAIAGALRSSIGELLGVPGTHIPSSTTPGGVHWKQPWETAVEPNAVPFKMEGASAERMRDDLPILGTALGAARQVDGEAIEQTTLNTGEVVQYARRPVILNGNAAAYGLYVAGSSMEPRHFDGEMLLVDPRGRVRGGEDVVVYLRTSEPEWDDGARARAVLVKRLVRRTSEYIELMQYNPERQFRVESADVVRIDRVIPWQEMLG